LLILQGEGRNTWTYKIKRGERGRGGVNSNVTSDSENIPVVLIDPINS